MEFVKMHGLGNDFIIVRVSSFEEAEKIKPYAKSLCHRHFGIGADGLVAIGRDEKADVFMRIFNADGSEAEMCGNAIRCVAKLAYEEKMVEKNMILVRTLAGMRNAEIILASDGRVQAVKVDMGEPILKRRDIPVDGEGEVVGIRTRVSTGEIEFTAVSMGNPHCVVFVEDVASFPITTLGPEIENHPLFPARTNAEFVQVLNEKEMIMRVWERGAGITLACGTGACASVVAAVLNGKTGRQVTVHLDGGDLFIEWDDREDNHVYMTGAAELVFWGKIDLDNLKIKI